MKVSVHSLGCKVNSYECDAIKSLILDYKYSSNTNDIEVFIINTCSVTATADQKSRQHIRKFRKLYPQAILVAMGCYVQGNAEFVKDIEADIVIGTSFRNKIPELIDKYLKNKKPIIELDDAPRNFIKYEELGITSSFENVRAYLKIQDGCDNFCSYCLIPYRRGKSRSRELSNIINEANSIVNKGYPEIVLTGIHVGGYGRDLDNVSFSSLVESLLNIENLKSLRISSIEATEIDDHLISLLKTKDNFAKHLHIPLQSGSGTVLKRMNRKYDKEGFLNKLNKIRESCPDVCITTDVIVGFPGETDEEFNETYKFIEECNFSMLHVFPFSSREGTAASKMPHQINPQIKKERTKKLIALSNELWDKYTDKFINKEVDVLIEEFDEETGLGNGHTSNYLELNIPTNKENVGKFIKTIYKK